jgi:hypothetical protein
MIVVKRPERIEPAGLKALGLDDRPAHGSAQPDGHQRNT